MKKTLKLALVISTLSLSTGLMAQTQTAPPPQSSSYTYLATNPFARMGRGIMNIAMCWIEIPRCMFYDNSQVPVAGLIYGSIEGAGFTTYRALAGIFDFLSLGYSGEGLYFKGFPEFFWQSRWLPKEDTPQPVVTPQPDPAPAAQPAAKPVAPPVAKPAAKPAAPAPAAKPADQPTK